MIAVIEYTKKQYKVSEGMEILVPETKSDRKEIKFLSILLVSDGKNTKIGTPYVDGASVEGEIIGAKRTKKIRVFKFRAKKRYKRTFGYRETQSRILIKKISMKGVSK